MTGFRLLGTNSGKNGKKIVDSQLYSSCTRGQIGVASEPIRRKDSQVHKVHKFMHHYMQDTNHDLTHLTQYL